MGAFELTFEDETTKVVHSELEELQKAFYALEQKNRESDAFTPSITRMYHTNIASLRKKNLKLKKDLAIETSTVTRRTLLEGLAEDQTALIREQIEQLEEFYAAQLIEKTSIVEQLDRDRNEIQDGIMERRRLSGGVYFRKHVHAKLRKTITMMGDRLHRARIAFDRRVTLNRNLRDEIDSMRMDNVVTEAQIDTLCNALLNCQRRLRDGVGEVHQTISGKNQARDIVMSLRKQNEIELEDFHRKWREMGVLMTYNAKMIVKILELSDKKIQHRTDEWARDKEAQFAKTMSAAAWVIARDKAQAAIVQSKCRFYEDHLRQLLDAIPMQDHDQLVDAIVRWENVNFEQFQQVRQLQETIDTLDNEMRTLQNEIEAYRNRRSGIASDGTIQDIDALLELNSSSTMTTTKILEQQQQRHAEQSISHTVVKQMQHKLNDVTNAMQLWETRMNDQDQDLSKMRSLVEDMLIDCRRTGISRETQLPPNVTSSTVIDFLGELEECVKTVLTTFLEQNNKNTNSLTIFSQFNATAKRTNREPMKDQQQIDDGDGGGDDDDDAIMISLPSTADEDPPEHGIIGGLGLISVEINKNKGRYGNSSSDDDDEGVVVESNDGNQERGGDGDRTFITTQTGPPLVPQFSNEAM